MPKKGTPAARASSAAAATKHKRSHTQHHREHGARHETIALIGGALIGGEITPATPHLVRSVMDEFGTRLPMMPKETAAVESLIDDHPDEPVSLTRRDPGESGPLLAHVGDTTYVIDGDTVTKEN